MGLGRAGGGATLCGAEWKVGVVELRGRSSGVEEV
jgi:hypothetical protein